MQRPFFSLFFILFLFEKKQDSPLSHHPERKYALCCETDVEVFLFSPQAIPAQQEDENELNDVGECKGAGFDGVVLMEAVIEAQNDLGINAASLRSSAPNFLVCPRM